MWREVVDTVLIKVGPHFGNTGPNVADLRRFRRDVGQRGSDFDRPWAISIGVRSSWGRRTPSGRCGPDWIRATVPVGSSCLDRHAPGSLSGRRCKNWVTCFSSSCSASPKSPASQQGHTMVWERRTGGGATLLVGLFGRTTSCNNSIGQNTQHKNKTKTRNHNKNEARMRLKHE